LSCGTHNCTVNLKHTFFYRNPWKQLRLRQLLLTTCADRECVNEVCFYIQMQPFTRVHSLCSTRHGTEKAWRWVRWECFSSFLLFFFRLRFGTNQGWAYYKCYYLIFLPCRCRFTESGPGFRLFVNPDPGFWRPKFKYFYSWKISNVIMNKMQYFYLPQLRAFRLQEKPPGPPKRTSSTSKHELSSLLFWVIFAFLDPDPKHSVVLSDIPLGRSWEKHGWKIIMC
jgi:hypothetical protein